MADRPAEARAAPAAASTGVPRPRWVATAAVLLAVGAILGAAYLVARAWDVDLHRPESGDVLFAQALEVGPKGVAVRVRIGKPSRVLVSVSGRAPLSVAFGPPRPPEAGPEDAPDETTRTTWTAEPGAGPHEEIVLAAGLYVLRLDPPSAGGSAGAAQVVEVRVTAAPPR